MTVGVLAYASHLPRYRLAGRDIGLRRGDRVVAAYDEDATTLAATAAAQVIPADPAPTLVYFATSTPAYADKTNATAIHAALALAEAVPVADLAGTARSTMAAVRAAAAGGGLVVAADVRVGKPGSSDERAGGDGAAALLFGTGDTIAEVIAASSRTAEFLDRWRNPSSTTGHQWEERFGATRYEGLIRETARQVLDSAGIADPDHVVVACPNTAVIKRAATLVKGQKSVTTSPVGHSGAADPLIALCGALDVAEPGETILLLSAADGCDAVLFRATDQLPMRRQSMPLSEQRAAGIEVAHLRYLAWRGLVSMESPRRPEPERPAAPPAGRSGRYKFGFTGSRCNVCGFTHLPPVRVCRGCRTADDMTDVCASQLAGRIVTYTVDRLAFSPSPPMVQAVVDVDGGGRCTLEVADARPDELSVGARVHFEFRRLFTADDVHDYFWKAVQDAE